MVPMLTCGLVRSNFAFATGVLLRTYSFASAGCAGGLSILDNGFLAAAASGARCTQPARANGELFPGGLRDDLLRDVRGNLAVGVELHAVARPALGLRPQVADVAEHLRQRHQGTDDAGTAAL